LAARQPTDRFQFDSRSGPPPGAENSQASGSFPALHDRGEIGHDVLNLAAIEERCISLLGLHASLAGNHLAVVSRRLAAVATIFLPISFLAGFWGENFNVLTGTIEKGWAAFLILGVGLNLACVVVTVSILSLRRWN
jgi:magnesium transporter